MTALVLYDSLYGNTEKIARAIGGALSRSATVVNLKTVKPEQLVDLDWLVVGSPTHGGRPTPAMKEFFERLPADRLKQVRTATFDTSIPVEGQAAALRFIIKFFGYAAKRLAAMAKVKGANVVAIESFFVLGKEGPLKAGEEARAAAWIKALAR